MKKYLFLLAAAGMFAFTSCDSDDDETTPSQTKTEMLTAKTWKITARTTVVTDSTGNSTTDSSLDDCEKDDTYKFMSDNKFTRDEGATKCDPNDPQTETGTWALSNNDKNITLVSSGITLPGELVELSTSKLVVKSTLDFFGDKYVITSTFNAQ